MKVTRLVRHFVFEEAERINLTIGNGARLDPRENVITLAGMPGAYSTAANISVRTVLWAPASTRAWLGFEVVAALPKRKDRTSPTSLGFRLSDGVSDFVWDTVASAWAAPGSHGISWSPEGDVANNIGTFFPTHRKLQIVVNLVTADKNFAPAVREIKVLWASDIDPIEDALLRSLVVDMKASLRPRAETTVPATGAPRSTLTIAQLPLQSAYNAKEIDAVFDNDADPNHLTNLVASFAGTTATLSPALPANHIGWVRFTHQPEVAITTSQDYIEEASTPSVVIRDVRSENVTEHGGRDWVVNKATGAATRVDFPTQGDLILRVEWHAQKLNDTVRIAGELHRYFSNRRLLRLRGVDEDCRLAMHHAFETDFGPEGDTKDLKVAFLTACLYGVIVSTRDAVDLNAIERLIIRTSPVVETEGDEVPLLLEDGSTTLEV